MTQKNRYDVSKLEEGQFEPGSNEQVLKNLLGIRKPREMDRLETEILEKTFKTLTTSYGKKHRFTTHDICLMHKTWLETIYRWAGQYRRTNLSKDDFHFAAAIQIPKLMSEFENKILSRYTPADHLQGDKLIHALAVIHVELILIHPFREGNGRIARLLSDLMCLQAGLPPLDYGIIKREKKESYFRAVQAGLDRNYKPMEDLFREIIKQSIQ